MDKLKGTFLIKSHGPRNYYLGNDYKFYDTFNIWTYGSKTYIKNALACIEQMFGCLGKVSTPLLVTDSHPELDDSPFLGLKNHRKFQMLLEMLQWLVTISRPDLSCLVATLNRFGACPRQLYLDLALRGFGYLECVPDPQIVIDHRPMQYQRIAPKFEILRLDFLNEYPEAVEGIDRGFSKPYGPILRSTILVDSDHAHDLKTRRSLTSVLAFVGSTPVQWKSKRQTTVASSTYAAKFAALRSVTKEAISLRYMLRCLGCNIPSNGACPTDIFGDNLSVIQNVQNPEADLSKKHVVISFHVVREAVTKE